MMGTLVVFGISHKTSLIGERERIFFGGTGQIGEALHSLSLGPSVSECVVVSTCNRVEIYAVCEDCEKAFDEISEFLCRFSEQTRRDFMEEKFYFLEGFDAVCHLYRVAAGMDSMVVGEPQILGQLKRAYEAAREARKVGTVLHKLFQSAFSTIKRIRNETGIGSHKLSVSSVAVKLARDIFGDIEKCSVMVVGTGEAAVEAATQLAKRGAGEIRIAGRNGSEAAKLALSLGGSAVKLEEVRLGLRKADIVISATGSSNYILKPDDVCDAMKLRKNAPISFIDIAFPRDIDPRVRDIENVFLYDMDDLQSIVDKNLDDLRKSLRQSEIIIKNHGEKFILWQRGLKAFPLIIGLRKKIEEMVKREIVKTIAKIDSLEETGDRDRIKRNEVLWALSHRITGKFLHKPVTKLKQAAANSSSEQMVVDAAGSLFGLSAEDLFEGEGKDWKQG